MDIIPLPTPPPSVDFVPIPSTTSSSSIDYPPAPPSTPISDIESNYRDIIRRLEDWASSIRRDDSRYQKDAIQDNSGQTSGTRSLGGEEESVGISEHAETLDKTSSNVLWKEREDLLRELDRECFGDDEIQNQPLRDLVELHWIREDEERQKALEELRKNGGSPAEGIGSVAMKRIRANAKQWHLNLRSGKVRAPHLRLRRGLTARKRLKERKDFAARDAHAVALELAREVASLSSNVL